MPVRNEERYIGEAIGSLLSGDYPSDVMEVLVVDGCSTDGTPSIAEAVADGDARVRVLRNEKRSTPAGLNVGLHAARGAVVVRMDGHTRPAPDYVRRCVEALDRTGASVVGGLMLGRGETAFGRAVAVAMATRFGAGDARFRIGGEGPTDTVYLGAWRRDVILGLGGFDEDLPRNQDYELCVRLRESGGVVWLDPRIRSTTLTRPSPGRLARQYYAYGMGRAATVVRHPGSLRARQLVPAALVGFMGLGMALVPFAPFAPFKPALRRLLRLLAGAYCGTAAVASVRAAGRLRNRDALWLPLAYAVMHHSWGAGFWVGLVREMRARRRRRDLHRG
jgi:glycosyltransferase involved in cell wall biosynthesis